MIAVRAPPAPARRRRARVFETRDATAVTRPKNRERSYSNVLFGRAFRALGGAGIDLFSDRHKDIAIPIAGSDITIPIAGSDITIPIAGSVQHSATPPRASGGFAAGALCVDRGDLAQRLLDSTRGLPNVRIHYSCSLVALDVRGARATFARVGDSDGAPRIEQEFDLLIGADGINSAVRAALQEQVPGFTVRTAADHLVSKTVDFGLVSDLPGYTPGCDWERSSAALAAAAAVAPVTAGPGTGAAAAETAAAAAAAAPVRCSAHRAAAGAPVRSVLSAGIGINNVRPAPLYNKRVCLFSSLISFAIADVVFFLQAAVLRRVHVWAGRASGASVICAPRLERTATGVVILPRRGAATFARAGADPAALRALLAAQFPTLRLGRTRAEGDALCAALAARRASLPRVTVYCSALAAGRVALVSERAGGRAHVRR
ncbi:hypothetical protein JKP88DRAFT_321865 [Tribonema minus]|uniref:Uncharacterized protein n=1 Tax=Tribonema minus TaxID=303371 RepID=A0A835YUS2_9STRA|nr:hypothetical protein JKP88DRAFT_321865 [Tribonema minus]